MVLQSMDLDALRSTVKGHVLTSEEEAYDVARTPWDLSVILQPQIVVIAEHTDDIIQAVHFARENGLKISVTNTGHGVTVPAEDSILIVVSALNNVEIDAEKQTAYVGAGAKWADVLSIAQDAGLAPLMGSSSDIGAVGYTLGGGMGWLARKYGLAVDNVISFDIVTADGQLLHASEQDHPEIFWALRGAGSAFGVVVGMEIKLFPVKTVYAGSLIYPREVAKDVFKRYKDWYGNLDDDWTTSISIMNLPPLPFIPEFLRGKTVVAVRGCYLGSDEQGQDEITAWVNWKEPLANLFDTISFRQADMISDDPKDPMPTMATNMILKEINDDVIDTLIQNAIPTEEPLPILIAEIHQAGGAIASIARNSHAFSQHEAPLILKLLGVVPTPEVKTAFINLTNVIKDNLKPHANEGAILNFLTGELKWKHAKEAFSPEAHTKLHHLKLTYDPDNTFCFSLNIFPE